MLRLNKINREFPQSSIIAYIYNNIYCAFIKKNFIIIVSNKTHATAPCIFR